MLIKRSPVPLFPPKDPVGYNSLKSRQTTTKTLEQRYEYMYVSTAHTIVNYTAALYFPRSSEYTENKEKIVRWA